MNPKLRTALIMIGIITLVILAIVFIPRGLSVYYQAKGGQQIEYVLRFEEGIDELVCDELPETNQEGFQEVEAAIRSLNRAARLNSNNSQAYYYLGKANCLLGDYEESIKAFETYLKYETNNPLGHLEFGLAIHEFCKYDLHESNPKNNVLGNGGEYCQNQDVNEQIKTELNNAGIDASHLIQAGNQSFTNREFEQSALWFSLAEILNSTLDSRERFLWLISAFFLDKQINIRNQVSTYEIDDLTTIEAEAMYWLTPTQFVGKELSEIPANDPNVGVLWTNGTAVAFVDISKEGEYELKLRVKNSPSTPINYQVEIDFDILEEFSSKSEESTWSEVVTYTTMDQGPHVIGVSFLNDSIVGEIDRNLIIDWIQISGPQS